MRFRFSPSIAHAIFALAGLLIVLMGVVAAINTTMSTRVGELIGSINRTYVPVYGHLARAHIRTLEQSLALRQAALGALAAPPQPTDAALEAERAAGAGADEELAAAQAALIKQTQAASDIDDRVLLGRITAQIEEVGRHRATYAQDRAEMVEALKARDPARIKAALELLDEIREEQNERLERVRRESMAFTGKAIEATQENEREVIRLTLAMLAIAVVLGAILAVWIARRMVGAIRRLVHATEAAEKGQYDAELPVTSFDEIGRLTRAFNLMLAELRLKQKIRDMFGRYIDPKVVAGLLDTPDAVPRAERQVATVSFTDMAGFSHFSEEVNPPLLVTVLNRYLSRLSSAIRERQGIVDKFLGDGVMAFWAAPFSPPADQARLACGAALEQVERFEGFRAELPDLIGIRRFTPRLGLRVGIATGDVIAGSIGSETALNYTVIGDAVNLASRLEGLGKVYGASILASAATARAAGDTFLFREVDRVVVVGRDEPEAVYELVGLRTAVGETELALVETYGEGLAAYRRRAWDEAVEAFRRCIALREGDGPSLVMVARCDAYRASPPGGDWTGAWAAPTK
jgi:adenylate cyclase